MGAESIFNRGELREFHRDRRWRLLSAAEGAVVAELLDELAGVWTNELLGLLAREMAVRRYDRIGV